MRSNGGEEVDAETRRALFAELDAKWPPPGMVELTPTGPRLAALLNTVSLPGLLADQLVEVAAGAARLASWAAAQEVAATAALTSRCSRFRGVGTGRDEVPAEQMAAAELGAELALSPVSARNRVELAQALARLPLTRIALAAGRIDLTKVRAMVDAVASLGDEHAAAVEARVLGRAPGQTAAAFRACLRRAVISVDPAGAEERREAKVADRGVWRQSLEDGMARREWVGPVEQVESTYSWLTAKAQAAKAADVRAGGAVRTLDEARSDVLADLGALGLRLEDLPRRHGRRPQVNVVVALSTLIGADDEPAELAGIGPIAASTARRIAAEGTWRRLLVDPRTGRLDEVSADTYAPPQDLVDFVIARDQTCRGLGCRIPAERCDLDHRVAYPEGPTAVDNFDPACRPWHRIKTLTDTSVEVDEHGGLWITLPSGRRYHRPAEPVLDHPGLVEKRPPEVQPPDDPDPPDDDSPDEPPF